MDTELILQGLMIAAIGMGLVFVVIIFLWGLMALLMRLTSGGEKAEADVQLPEQADDAQSPEVEQIARLRRAAAGAVAVGLAQASHKKSGESASRVGPHGGISSWQAFHRSRQVTPEQKRG